MCNIINMYANEIVIYTSATSKDELEYRLHVCIVTFLVCSYELIKGNLMAWLLEANVNEKAILTLWLWLIGAEWRIFASLN